MDVRTITDALQFTRNYWSAVENDRKILSVEKLTVLMDVFEFDDEERHELLELREAAKERGWWTRYSALFDEHLLRYFGLEQGAQAVRTYESLLHPGLLQCEAYVRAIMAADVTVRPVEIDERVHFRIRRQRLLDGDDPLRLTAVISQAALLQQIGGPDVLHQQLEHLVRVIEGHPGTIEVRIIPFTARGCGLFGASTVNLVDFASPRLPAMAWQETVTTTGFIADVSTLRDLSRTYTVALGSTLDTQGSLALIKDVVGGYGDRQE